MLLMLSILLKGKCSGSSQTSTTSKHSSSLIASINEKCKFPSEAESDRVTSGMRYFGLFSSDKAVIRGGNLLDALCGQLEKLCSFQPGERDLVMLQHKFVVEWKDGKKVSDAPRWISCQKSWHSVYVLYPHIDLNYSGTTKQKSWLFSLFSELDEPSRLSPWCSSLLLSSRQTACYRPRKCKSANDLSQDTFTSTLELLGDPKGYSGMSKFVGVTCGIATQLLLDGHPALNVPGVLAPYEKEICDPIRELLEREGINMVEKTL